MWFKSYVGCTIHFTSLKGYFTNMKIYLN
uniref:Uncharacterized protein n=1 Tax=Arundo donax TaxID=35708 RepID=A0A0A9H5V3_ARUDO